MKIEFKGYIKSVMSPVDRKGTLVQDIVIRIPERKDEFETVVSKEQFYPMALMREKIDEYKLQYLIGKKVMVTGYLNGREIVTQSGIQYGLSLVVKEIKFLD